MKVPRAFATSRLGGYLGTGQMPLSTPKYRFLALQLTSSVKLDIKIAINTQGNYCKALFIVFTTGFVLEMAHVQIRGGVADWYWTADPQIPRFLQIFRGIWPMPLSLLNHSALALFAQRTRIPTSARSIGFCAIWVCISSSSSSTLTLTLTPRGVKESLGS